MEKLVTVIMSTHDTNKEYLSESIKSILSQEYKNIEFIIVCDGIKEEYDYIKRNFDDKRIKLILNEENMGLPFSLNKAIKKSKGEYIARMDSDDYSLPFRIKTQVKYLEENKNIEICGTYAKCFGKTKSRVRYKYIKPEEIEIQMLYIPLLVHPTVMFRKNFFKDGRKYNDNFKCSQDYELWSKTVNSKNIAIIPKYCLKYRIHESQAGIRKKAEQIKNTKIIHEYNTSKIKYKNKEEVIKALAVLYGIECLNKNNYISVSNTIDEIIKSNDYFNTKILKKIFYNRYFIQLIKSKKFLLVFNYKIFFKIFNWENFKYIIWKIMGV